MGFDQHRGYLGISTGHLNGQFINVKVGETDNIEKPLGMMNVDPLGKNMNFYIYNISKYLYH